MDSDDNLVQLLNGLGLNDGNLGSIDNSLLFQDEVYYINGQATDHFLEALKSDLQLQERPERAHPDRYFAREHYDNQSRSPDRNDVIKERRRRVADVIKSQDIPTVVEKLSASKYKGIDRLEDIDKKSSAEHDKRQSKTPSYSKPLDRSAWVDTERAQSLDFTKEEVMLETKVKSLELRLLGQLKTIRSLEKRNSELEQALQEKDQILISTSARLKANEQPVESGKVFTGKAVSSVAVAKIDKLNSQLEFLQVRIGDEQSRRQRAEDRCKALRDYLESSKAKCIELEKKELEWQQSSHDMHSRIMKYRKECKELSKNVHDQ